IGMDGEFNRAYWKGGKALLNQRVCKITSASEALVDTYLYWFLPDALQEIERVTPFVTVKHLSVKQIQNIVIPLPPVSEQRRIAQILAKADALRTKRRAAIAQLETLTQSIFLDMFGDPAANPKKWEVCTVESYVESFQGGRSFEGEADATSKTQSRVLRVSAVTSMQFIASESKRVPDTYVPPKEHFVRAGDLLFSRANTSELVGAVAIVERAPENLLLPDKIWR